MKTVSPSMEVILASDQFYLADLYDITLAGGTVLRLTSAPVALIYASQTYAPAVIKRDSTRLVVGLEVDSMNLTVHDAAAIAINVSTLLQVATNGGLDGARVRLRRAAMATWGDTSAGLIHLFEGRIGEVETDRGAAVLTVNSDIELLDVKLPRRTFQAGCGHRLYGHACGLSASSWQTGTVVQAGSTASLLLLSSISGRAFGFFEGGVAVFVTGNLTGVRRTIKTHQDIDRITLTSALPVLPAAGDQVMLRPGCDKARATCASKFDNVVNFGGYPFVPKPEALI